MHEGFKEQGPGYSTRVAFFSEDELDQIFQLRLQLEGFAASCAAQFAVTDQIHKLHSLATQMSKLTPPDGNVDNAELSS